MYGLVRMEEKDIERCRESWHDKIISHCVCLGARLMVKGYDGRSHFSLLFRDGSPSAPEDWMVYVPVVSRHIETSRFDLQE
jgi:hypothetical protein